MTASATLAPPVADWSSWGGGCPRTAREVLAEAAGRPDFLLDGLIHPTATLLTGPPKAGKSFLVVEWVEALAKGREWHGRRVHSSAPALILPTDPGGFDEYARRLRSDALDDVVLAHPPKPGDLDGWQRLALYALHQGVGLVVLDNIYGYNPTANINHNGEVGVTLAGLGVLARAGVPYLAVHHPPKGGHAGYAGATSIEAHFRHLVYMDKAGRLTIGGNDGTGSSLQLVRGSDGRTTAAGQSVARTNGGKVSLPSSRQATRERQVQQAVHLLAQMPDGLPGREEARLLVGAVDNINTEGKARTLRELAKTRLAQATDGHVDPDADSAVNALATG